MMCQMLVPVGNDLYEVPSPSLLAVAEEVVGRGISIGSARRLSQRRRKA